MPIFSSPAASFTEYANRIESHGITYQNDAQYISDITFQLGFAIPNDTKDPKIIQQHQQHYIDEIVGMIDGCAQALSDCMKSRGH